RCPTSRIFPYTTLFRSMLKRFQKAGHKPIALVGGGTGMIGDPSGRSTERTLNDRSIVKQYSEKIKQQITSFINANDDKNPVTVRSEEHTSELQSRFDLV